MHKAHLLAKWERSIYRNFASKILENGTAAHAAIAEDWDEGLRALITEKPEKKTNDIFVQGMAIAAAQCGSVKSIAFLYKCCAHMACNIIRAHSYARAALPYGVLHSFPLKSMLCCAAENGHLEAMRIVYILGARDLESAICSAVVTGRVWAVRLACEWWMGERNNGDLLESTFALWRALDSAVESGYLYVVAELMNHINFSDEAVSSALDIAIDEGKTAIVKYIVKTRLEKVRDTLADNFADASGLMRKNVMKVLLPYLVGADRREALRGAIKHAAEHRNEKAMKIVEWLRTQGGSINREDYRELTEYEVIDEDPEFTQRWNRMLEECVAF